MIEPMTAMAVASFGMAFASGVSGASASRKSARAQMAALKAEKAWNLGVMERNKTDVFNRQQLSSYGSGIDPTTGSNAAVMAANQKILQDEIDFQTSQYNAQLKNLRAQSKQKFLGIF